MNTETLMNSTKTVSIVGMAKYLTEKNLERADYLEISWDLVICGKKAWRQKSLCGGRIRNSCWQLVCLKGTGMHRLTVSVAS